MANARRTLPFVWICLCAGLSAAGDEPPRSLDPRLRIDRFAAEPQVVTPTGLDVDAQGRVWVVESNTHQTPPGYVGHPTDRILVMRDSDGDRLADDIAVFADGFVHSMSIAVRPSGDIYLATRKEILRFRDDDGDLKPDRQERIMWLDTPGDYPHNGLAGFALDALDYIYFGEGENLGADYTLRGSDGKTHSGGGEGGNLYRCRLDGSGLEHVATGFWNPHASCVDAFGRIFTVDNDPDYRPPCRLLHIVPGGDYGYRYRNGRRGIHPFTAWDGELPGTLPMVAGTGEAPSGIIAYESDGLPAEYIGNLLATSWGDHRIDRFRLTEKGASFTSKAEPLIVGGENFRPVGLAVAPDGSIYATDWVLKDYPVHGRGAVWRITSVEPSRQSPASAPSGESAEVTRLRELASPRMDVRRAAARALAKSESGRAELQRVLDDPSPSDRSVLEAFWALLRVDTSETRLLNGRFNRRLSERDDVRAEVLSCITPMERYRADVISSAEWVLSNWASVPYSTRKQFDSSAQSPTVPAFLLPVLRDASQLDRRIDVNMLVSLLESGDPFLYRQTVLLMSKSSTSERLTAMFRAHPSLPIRSRIASLLAARIANPQNTDIVRAALADRDPAIQRAAIQWVAEERLEALRPQVDEILSTAQTSDVFEAGLAALEQLDGIRRKPADESSGGQYILALVTDAARSPAVRARALSMLGPGVTGFKPEMLAPLVASPDPNLKLEAVRTLAQFPSAESASLLRSVAVETSAETRTRVEAVAGLGNVTTQAADIDAVRRLLVDLIRGGDAELQIESLRTLRTLARRDAAAKQDLAALVADPAFPKSNGSPALAEQYALASRDAERAPAAAIAESLPSRPASLDEWIEAAKAGGDPEAGRRVFFHAGAGGCAQCHTVNGRGGRIGPDLSLAARMLDRKKFAESILDPEREVAPQFTLTTLVTRDGKSHSGVIVAETREGLVRLGSPEGTVVELRADEIDERVTQRGSLMPRQLIDRLTVSEFRDLVAFLETLR